MATVRYVKGSDPSFAERRDMTARDAYALALDLVREANAGMGLVATASRTLSIAATGGMWDEGAVRIRVTVTDEELDAMTAIMEASFPRRPEGTPVD